MPQKLGDREGERRSSSNSTRRLKNIQDVDDTKGYKRSKNGPFAVFFGSAVAHFRDCRRLIMFMGIEIEKHQAFSRIAHDEVKQRRLRVKWNPVGV